MISVFRQTKKSLKLHCNKFHTTSAVFETDVCQWSFVDLHQTNNRKKKSVNSVNSLSSLSATSHQMIEILHFTCGGEHESMPATTFSQKSDVIGWG